VIVATATLEVGYDDPHVGAVVQHKAPHDAARFVQRKGRAGRDPSMRPWTAVVLGDWGRDRVAWELYDQLFDPELEPRHLPLKNRYVLRMQAVYSTLDWLGARLESLGRDRSAWIDVVAPGRDSHEVRTRTPLREFIAGNLFDDLLTPEVEVLVPTGARDEAYEAELLPAIRTLRELMPGNVTRHFGVSSFSRRHWVPLD